MVTANGMHDWGGCVVRVESTDDLDVIYFEVAEPKGGGGANGEGDTMSDEANERHSASESDQVVYAQQMLAESREELTRAEGKAGMLLSASLVAVSVLGGAALAGDWSPLAFSNCWRWALWGGLTAWIVAVVELLWAAFPRIGKPSDRRHLTYFRHADMHESSEDLRRSLAAVAHDPLHRLVDQLWNVSKVVVRKYRRIQRALVALGAGGILLGVVSLLEMRGPSAC